MCNVIIAHNNEWMWYAVWIHTHVQSMPDPIDGLFTMIVRRIHLWCARLDHSIGPVYEFEGKTILGCLNRWE